LIFFGGTGHTTAGAKAVDGVEAMPVTVRLKDIVDALGMQFDESSSFLDLDSGQVEIVSTALLNEAEESDDDEEPDLPAFEKLPTKFNLHEWAIMQNSRMQWSPAGFAKTS
jgi:hypothetical protein